MKTLRPVNQKSVYHSFGEMYEKIMNDELAVDKAEVAVKALSGMNKTYALELKRAEIELAIHGGQVKTEIRTVEIKNFENIPIDENSNETKKIDQ